jgi:hypothetical protein
MKTQIESETECPFTAEQLKALTEPQRQAIEAVAEYLTGNSISEESLSDEEITGTFNLLKTCAGCVPSEEAGEDLLNTIRKKFGAVYQVGMELAEVELKQSNFTNFKFCMVVDPSYEDTTHVVIVDYEKPICYLHKCSKAWHLGFQTFGDLADAVLAVKKSLVEKVTKSTEIFVVMEGGVVHEIVDLPDHIHVTLIDYDTEGVEKERLEISPVDGELCAINRW